MPGEEINKEEIVNIYEKIKHKLEYRIATLFKQENLIPNEEIFWVEPDFLEINAWKITTYKINNYSIGGSFVEKESLLSVKGKMHISKGNKKLEPSFEFEFESNGSKFSFNPSKIRKIIEDLKEKESWSIYSMAGKEKAEEFLVSSEEKDKKTKALQEESLPMLKGIGFSENESNTMILGAMAHSSFQEDMTPEGIVGLALRIRGEDLLK